MTTRKTKRINNIISFLQKKNGASVKELATRFNVSEMTIRRDLNALEEQNLVTLVHGAAIYNSEADLGQKKYEVQTEKDKQAQEKSKISQKAASLIEPHDVIIIDVGTTTEFITRWLPDDLPITVVCYSANTLVQLYKKPNIRIYFAGGYYHHNSQMFESPEGNRLIERICANKAFISAAGVCKKLGVTCVSQYEIATKHAALGSALSRILLVDSTKFDQIKPSHFAELSDFDTVITDSRITDDWIEYIQGQGLELYIV